MSVGSLGVIPGVQAEAVEALIGARAALETPGDAVLMHGSRRSYIREKKTVAVRQINTI